jgi:dolichyl-phosphate-mannose--protein O-mannosyl transferase
MRNTQNITITRTEPMNTDTEETTWSLSGAVVGFVAWLLALGIPFLLYGSNTLFFFLYTWPFFLALLPVSVVIGIALHSLMNGKLLYSIVVTLITVAVLFGLLFLWLLG